MSSKRSTSFVLKLTEAEFTSHREEYDGYCLYCNEFTYGGVEPDATRYLCEGCGEKQLFGIEELLLEGLIEIVKSHEKILKPGV